jgi:hypothetical protein
MGKLFHPLIRGVILAIIFSLIPAAKAGGFYATAFINPNLGLTDERSMDLKEVIGTCGAFDRCTVVGRSGVPNPKALKKIRKATKLRPTIYGDRAIFEPKKSKKN